MKIRAPEKKYNFWFRNGHVIDPRSGVDRIQDVLVRNSRIVPIPENGVNPGDVAEIVDCTGMYVFPGLINFHAHYGWTGNSGGLNPAIYELPNGVTAVCDAGSTGSSTFEGFCKNGMMGADVTMRAFLNVAAGGLTTGRYIENIDPDNYDVRAMEYIFEMYRDYIVGLKVRIGKDINDGMGLLPLLETRKLAEKFQVPLALHATWPLEPMQEIIPQLRCGDILCHTFQEKGPHNILDENGRIRPEVWEGRKRGVIFDCAHGRIHFSYRVARRAIEQGFLPDVISTDAISVSVYRDKLFNLPMVMSRCCALGMPLYEVVRACTQTPARLMGLDGYIGTLQSGALADICVMKKDERMLTLTDTYGEEQQAEFLLIPQMTLRAGRIMYRTTGFTF